MAHRNQGAARGEAISSARAFVKLPHAGCPLIRSFNRAAFCSVLLLALSTGGEGFGQPPLKILSAEEDLTAATILISGMTFGPEVFDTDGSFVFPSVHLAGVPLTVQTYQAETEIVAQLPGNIQPGTYLLEVASPTNIDGLSVKIGGTSETQLIIRSVEVDFDPSACQNPCAGTLLISGLNLGSTTSFGGTVELFVPMQGMKEISVIGFEPLAQEILAEIPPSLNETPGSFLLRVSTGGSEKDTGFFHATLEEDADPTNEIQFLSRIGSEIVLSHGGGMVSIDGGDSDPTNELQVLTREDSTITLSQGGGSVSLEDADADPTNELQTLSLLPGNNLELSHSGGVVPLNPDIFTDEQRTALGRDALGNSSGPHNTAVGFLALQTNSTGQSNTALGYRALWLNATSSGNTALGAFSLVNNTAASNTAVGLNTLSANTTGSANTAVGVAALRSNETATDNTALGMQALTWNTTGGGNTALGRDSLLSNLIGASNTGVGLRALYNSTGSENTALGFLAGFNLEHGDGNVYIQNPGEASESGTIRIGQSGAQERAFLAGVRGVTVGADAHPVVIDSNGQLGTAPAGDQQGSLVRTVIVSPVPGDPLASGAALLAATSGITDSSDANPHSMILEPGIYDIDTSVLDVPTYTKLRGAGAPFTTIRGSAVSSPSVNCGCSGGMVVVLANESALESLRIEHIGQTTSTPFGAVFIPSGKTALVRDVAIDVGGFVNSVTGNKAGNGVRVQNSIAVLESVRVLDSFSSLIVQISSSVHALRFEDEGAAFGISADHSSIEFIHSFTSRIDSGPSAIVTARESLVGSVNIFGSPSGVVRLANSQFTGLSQAGLKCVNSFNGNFDPLDSNCN